MCSIICEVNYSKGGVIKYETDRGGSDLKILLKNLVAQHKQQKDFPAPTVSSKKFHGPLNFFTMNCTKVTWYIGIGLKSILILKDSWGVRSIFWKR